jgi:hypothetical protein
MADEEINPIDGIIRFQIQRRITGLVRENLNVLEELLAAGFHFDYKLIRKRLLDRANDDIREINLLFDKLDISPRKH